MWPLLAAAALLVSHAAQAQSIQPEFRVDVMGPRPYSVEPGAGIVLAMGYYARLSGIAGYALEPRADLIEDRWRADLLGRFTLDPFRQQRWALSVGGGLSVRRRTYLAAFAEFEGPEMRGLMPALQVGVSGGVRAAVILRHAVPGRR